MLAKKHRYTFRTRAAVALATTTAIGAAMVLPAGSAEAAQAAAQCWFGSCYSYVGGQQYATATGARVTMYQADPAEVYGSGHSLQELSLQNTDSTTTADTVEIGWSVDPSTFGDNQPHLFVYHWVNGNGTCYDGCGFVPISSSVTVGMAVTPGTSASFALINYSGNWWAYYNNVPFGYFPGSLWGGAFSTAYNIQAFGEADAPSQPSCEQMGDGAYGSQSGSSSISNFQLFGSSSQPDFSVSDTDPSYYNYGSVTATSFRLGGPGGC